MSIQGEYSILTKKLKELSNKNAIKIDREKIKYRKPANILTQYCSKTIN